MEWLVLLCGAFLAGLVDAVVGGGGLIQLPLLLTTFPTQTVSILFGTNKFSSIFGTASATWQYLRKIHIPYRVVGVAAAVALVGSALGAAIVSMLSNAALKPMVLVLLLAVGAYTFFKPAFGKEKRELHIKRPRLRGAGLGGAIGFYDGFFGPGTGSFLIFGFVRLFGMDMLQASASAKLVNLCTNLGALGFFFLHEGVMWHVGAAMAAANVAGAQLGSRLAMRHGNGFVRALLLIVVSVLIVKLGWDIYRAH